MLRMVLVLSLMLASLLCSACLSLEPASTQTSAPSRQGDLNALLSKAQEQRRAAGSRKELRVLIETYETILEIDPEHEQTLSDLAQYHMLMGAAYPENLEEKKQQYRKAIAYSERIMYLNSEFKRRVSAGQTVWDASEVLTINEADGMGWWTTTVFYYFKECIPDAFKIFNSKWITRNRIIMDKLEVVSPDWNGGANYFNFGIYYLALPDAFGGSLAKSAEYLQKAESTDPKRLLYPWGRAKYFYAYQKNRQGFEKDLEWVLAQDPHLPTGDTYPWNVYFQTQARELLSSIDVLF
jgi:tetratricopeptide (TPR) repeat protein